MGAASGIISSSRWQKSGKTVKLSNRRLNLTGIDFPTPVKQIDRLEKQNQNLAINVFGWEKESVIGALTKRKRGKRPEN